MSEEEFYTIAAIPRDPTDILDIIRCHIIALTSASGQAQHLLILENIIRTLDDILPGFLEACFKKSSYESIEKMVEEACKNLGSKNVIKKISANKIIYPSPSIPPSISIDITILQHPIMKVYKMIFRGTQELPIHFERVVRWYMHLYKKKLTPALFAQEFNLDPNAFKNYAKIVEKSGMFYVHKRFPLHIQAHTSVRVAVFESLTEACSR